MHTLQKLHSAAARRALDASRVADTAASIGAPSQTGRSGGLRRGSCLQQRRPLRAGCSWTGRWRRNRTLPPTAWSLTVRDRRQRSGDAVSSVSRHRRRVRTANHHIVPTTRDDHRRRHAQHAHTTRDRQCKTNRARAVHTDLEWLKHEQRLVGIHRRRPTHYKTAHLFRQTRKPPVLPVVLIVKSLRDVPPSSGLRPPSSRRGEGLCWDAQADMGSSCHASQQCHQPSQGFIDRLP